MIILRNFDIPVEKDIIQNVMPFLTKNKKAKTFYINDKLIGWEIVSK